MLIRNGNIIKKRMKKYLLFLIGFIITLNSSKAQDSTVYIDSTEGAYPKLPDVWKEVILTENKTGTKFILDSSRIFIMAVDTLGKIFWITDPYMDNHLMETNFIERPHLMQFYFRKDKLSNYMLEIFIYYSNRQFGFVNLKTGKFTFLGEN